jgi:hypothetical protein
LVPNSPRFGMGAHRAVPPVHTYYRGEPDVRRVCPESGFTFSITQPRSKARKTAVQRSTTQRFALPATTDDLAFGSVA